MKNFKCRFSNKIKDPFNNKYYNKLPVLKNPKYLPYPPNEISMVDSVVFFDDGKYGKIIPLFEGEKHEIIHDEMRERVSKKKFQNTQISLTFCNKTKTVVGYEGLWGNTGHTKHGNIILYNIDNNDNVINQLTGIHINDTELTFPKIQLSVLSLKEALIQFPDAIYLESPKIKKTAPPSVFGIEYHSIHKNEHKYVALVPKTYSFVQIDDYYKKLKEEFSTRGGIIIPTSLKIWKKMHKSTKVIDLQSN